MSVAFLTRDFSGQPPNLVPAGCSYYRCFLPMSVLGRGHRMGLPAWDPIRGFGVKESATVGTFGFKQVMLKLLMDRWTPKQVELAQRLGQRVFTDVDDYYEGLTESNRAFDLTHPEKNKKSNRDFYKMIIDTVDVLTVSTPFLLDHYSKQRDNVFMVRNGVNIHQFQPRQHRNTKPVIGWTGATGYRNGDLEPLREWLPDFLEEHDLTFHHAGHDPSMPAFYEITGIPEHRVTTSSLCSITEYAANLKFDIGIVPLNDIPFNHAKSNIKGLEYAAAGIPFVASDLPEYRLLSEDGVGLMANSPDTWVAQLETLLDYRTRRKAAMLGRDVTSQKWSIEQRAKEWFAVFADK